MPASDSFSVVMLVIGAAFLLSAVVWRGLKILNVDVPKLRAWQCWLIGVVGAIALVAGIVPALTGPTATGEAGSSQQESGTAGPTRSTTASTTGTVTTTQPTESTTSVTTSSVAGTLPGRTATLDVPARLNVREGSPTTLSEVTIDIDAPAPPDGLTYQIAVEPQWRRVRWRCRRGRAREPGRRAVGSRRRRCVPGWLRRC